MSTPIDLPIAGVIKRDVAAAARQSYDLIIIGGGAYGALAAWEASRRGLRSLVLEQSDFGGATTWNSTRFVHGGLRYLQTFDLARSRQSIRQRRWYFRHFPEHIRPLQCVVGLSGRGLKRPALFRLALAANDLLGWDRNQGVGNDARLPASGVISEGSAAAILPHLQHDRLVGAATWYDGMMVHPQRILIETLRWACGLGATALNYCEVTELMIQRGRVAAVRAVDLQTGRSHEFSGGVVLNCGGAAVRQLAARFDRDLPALMRPVRLTNLLVKLTLPAPVACGFRPPQAFGTYFLIPFGERTLIGTHHAPAEVDDDPSTASEDIDSFLNQINQSLRDVQLSARDVCRVFSGWLPATHSRSLEIAHRPVVIDHSRRGGPKGLVSISGIKWTTARPVLQRTLARLFPNGPAGGGLAGFHGSRRPLPQIDFSDPANMLATDRLRLRDQLRLMVQEESVMHLDDLLLRRTDWGFDPAVAAAVAAPIGKLLPWPAERLDRELLRVKRILSAAASPVTPALNAS